MNIWLIKVGEPVPTDQGDIRLYRTGMLAQMLAQRNHQVTWWTSTVDHIKKKQRFHKDKTVHLTHNLRIIFLHSLLYKKNVGIRRIINHIGMARAFQKISQRLHAPDVILCCLPTLELCQAAIQYGQTYDVPVLIDIRDLWPDIFLKLAPPWSSPLFRILLQPMFGMAQYTCRNATAITGITSEMVDWGLDYADRARSSWDRDFPFGYSTEKPDHELISQSFRKWEQFGVHQNSDKFIACFFGSFGRQFELETVIAAARDLESDQRYRGKFQFILCGDGDRFSYFLELAKGCNNVLFPGWVERVDIWTLMRLSSIGLTPNHSTKDFAMAISNKPIEYMSAGLPIVSSLDGKLKRLLTKYSCGLTYPNRDIQGLVEILVELRKNSSQLELLSKNSAKVFTEKFSATKVYGEMIHYLESIVEAYPHMRRLRS